ncbi:MAG: hypothetical protein HRT45_13975 [Bdellovibrionales bacterium]|nr:hypothetical protein [Bdellovibrionales bacterium]
MTKHQIGLTFASALIVMSGSLANAQTTEKSSESKTKIDKMKPGKNKVEGDIDSEVTNARMRATSGSKSKYSLSSSLSWLGGRIADPFIEERPNIVGDPSTETATSFSGSFSGRYRWTKNSSVTLGIGAGVLTPLQGNIGYRGRENQMNVTDPFLSYSYVGKLGRFQTINSFSVAAGTSEASQDVDNVARASWSPNFLTTIEGTKLTLGMAAGITYNFYGGDVADGEVLTDSGANIEPFLTTYSVALFPYMEYAFSDKYQFRTVFGYFNWRHIRSDDSQSPVEGLSKLNSYQSTGINMILTRDIFLYPYFQFSPDDMALDKTTLAMSATLNVF